MAPDPADDGPPPDPVVADPAAARATLRDLRRTRQRRRLGDTDWYDIAYRVYLFGLVGLTLVVWVSDAIDGIVDDDVTTSDLLARGPATIGLTVTVAFALGLRSGADGGPVSIEVADVRHVLTAPISRRTVMLRPIGQRLRSMSFAAAVFAAVLGQLVATEVEGSRAAWAAACAAAGAVVGVTFVATAVIAHALAVPRWSASLLGAAVVTWQAVAAWSVWRDGSEAVPAPGNLTGSLALWGVDQRPIDLIAVVGAAGLAVAALLAGGRLRIEPLVRRGRLVSQLRFAATVQDLRTVVLLRRQLRSEVPRRDVLWRRRVPRRPDPQVLDTVRATTGEERRAVDVWRRGARSLGRLPAARLVRIGLLAVAGGIAAALTFTASPLWAVALVAAAFLATMESLEPLSQEVDHPDLTDGLAVDRGWLHTHHLVAPAVLLVGVALTGAAAAALVAPELALGAVLVGVPMVWAAASGPVVVTVGDAPVPASSTTLLGTRRDAESALVPPEFAGFRTAVRTLVPVALTAVATAPVLVARATGDAASVTRAVVGLVLFTGAVVLWVRRRDRWSVAVRDFLEQGRTASA